jgi:nicotinamidase/pyrazinamidase
MNALILIDIQNDFVPGGNLAVSSGDQIIPLVNALQSSFTLVVATQDWHPANHKSFASNHPGKKPFEKIMLNDLEQVLWPDHCVQGTAGAAFHPGLQMNQVEAIFRKGMDPEIDSYSGFFDNGQKKSTGLSGYLRDRKVDKVFICGLAGDYCVAYTAKDALRENFKTFIIEDATRPIDVAGFGKMMSEIKGLGGRVIGSDMLSRYL